MSESLLTVKNVAIKTGFHPRSIYRFVRNGSFPKPIKIDGNTRWLESEVQQWISLKIQSFREGAECAQ